MKVPITQEEVEIECRRGTQWCHICRDFNCGDNTNPDKSAPKETQEGILELQRIIKIVVNNRRPSYCGESCNFLKKAEIWSVDRRYFCDQYKVRLDKNDRTKANCRCFECMADFGGCGGDKKK